MHQIRFRLPSRGAYSVPPDLLVAFKGLLLREGRLEMVDGRESGGNERGGKRRGPPKVDSHPMSEILKIL